MGQAPFGAARLGRERGRLGTRSGHRWVNFEGRRKGQEVHGFINLGITILGNWDLRCQK